MKKAPKKSKYPDKSPWAKGYYSGYQKACDDLNEAKKDVMVYGFCMHTLLTLFLMLDKYKVTADQLQQLEIDMMEYEKMVNDGFMTYQQMEQTLRDVYGIDFTWKNDLHWEGNKIKDRRYE